MSVQGIRGSCHGEEVTGFPGEPPPLCGLWRPCGPGMAWGRLVASHTLHSSTVWSLENREGGREGGEEGERKRGDKEMRSDQEVISST